MFSGPALVSKTELDVEEECLISCLVKTEGQDDDVGDGWLVQGGGSKQVAWQRYTREGEWP